eukprot:5810457-Pleurochrysis_carterae.AAC.1
MAVCACARRDAYSARLCALCMRLIASLCMNVVTDMCKCVRACVSPSGFAWPSLLSPGGSRPG